MPRTGVATPVRVRNPRAPGDSARAVRRARGSARAGTRGRGRRAACSISSGTSSTASRNDAAQTLSRHSESTTRSASECQETRSARSLTAGVEEDRPQRRQRPGGAHRTIMLPSRSACHRFGPGMARRARRLDFGRARAARGGSPGPRPQGPAGRPRHRDGAHRGVQRAQDLRPAAARRSRGCWSRTSPGTASSSTSASAGCTWSCTWPARGWIRWKDEVPDRCRRVRAARTRSRPGWCSTTQSGLDITEAGTKKSLAIYLVRDPQDVPGIASARPGPAHRRLHPGEVPRHPRGRGPQADQGRAPPPGHHRRASATPTPTRSCTPRGCRRSSRQRACSRPTTTPTS